MSRTGSAERIPMVVNKSVTLILFGLAIVLYAIRNYIRLRVLKQFSVEDYLLLLAAICLIAATGLTCATMPYHYNSLQAILEGDFVALSKLLGKIPQISKEENTAATLWWFVIFPVKLAYLVFFRRLILRVRGLNVWWRIAAPLTVLGGIACLIADWLTCPYFETEKLLRSCTGPSTAHRSIRITSVTSVMDVVTDLIVISFPLALLWNVRINLHQKFGLGVILCLSVVMIVIAIVRIAGIRRSDGQVDIVWVAFWQQQESSIAVMMFCLTAFRSLFIGHTTKKRQNAKHGFSPSYWRQRLMRRRLGSDNDNDDERDDGLPQIPRATMTGMTTMIRDARLSTFSDNLRYNPQALE